MKKVICLSCGRKVEVKLVKYADGNIATCPVCNKLAYSVGAIYLPGRKWKLIGGAYANTKNGGDTA